MEEATMTGLPVNSKIMETLGQKRYEIHTPKKGNYRAKRPKQKSRDKVLRSPSVISYMSSQTMATSNQ